MAKFKKLPFFISTLLIGAQAHQALAGGTVEVTSLLGYSEKNSTCELSEAVEAINQEATVDSCVYRAVPGKTNTITFAPSLFLQGNLPKEIAIVSPLNFIGSKNPTVTGPG